MGEWMQYVQVYLPLVGAGVIIGMWISSVAIPYGQGVRERREREKRLKELS